jgi:hypothetical protein
MFGCISKVIELNPVTTYAGNEDDDNNDNNGEEEIFGRGFIFGSSSLSPH